LNTKNASGDERLPELMIKLPDLAKKVPDPLALGRYQMSAWWWQVWDDPIIIKVTCVTPLPYLSLFRV